MILREAPFQICNVSCICIQVFAIYSVYEQIVDKTEWKQITGVLLDGCDTWSLTLREERIVRMFENRVLGKVFVLNRETVKGDKSWLYYENFMICVSHEMSFGLSYQE